MTHRLRLNGSAQGFTLIELMIATAIFSIILLICLGAFIQIGRMYYKGITTSRTQEVARDIMDDISREIQFSGSTVTPSSPSTPRFCVGTKRYTFVLNRQLTDNNPMQPWQTHNVLLKDELGSASLGCPPSTGSGSVALSNPQELISENMRLVTMDVTDISNASSGSARLWQVDIKLLYGDNDVLFDSTNKVFSSADGYNAIEAGCQGLAFSSQFCAISSLSTVVERRLK